MEIQEQISRFVDDELVKEEQPAMFSHMVSCTECQEFLQDALRLRSGLNHEKGEAPIPAAPGSQNSESLFPAFFSFSRSRWIPSRRVSLSFPVAAVLALFLMAASAVVTLSTTGGADKKAPNEVILISLPPVEVQGTRLPDQPVQQ